MKTAPFIPLLAALGLSNPALGEPGWAYVPASREACTLGVIARPFLATEGVVCLVGADQACAVAPPEPRHVLRFEPSVAPGYPVDGSLEPNSDHRSVPEGALWPDASGHIVAASRAAGGSLPAASRRNPWEVRAHAASRQSDTVFLFGGIITGGEGGPVALLNGRVVRRGDVLGGFSVVAVLAAGVVLESRGTCFVVPRGMRTTVTTVDG
jgi:hypothetical protein